MKNCLKRVGAIPARFFHECLLKLFLFYYPSPEVFAGPTIFEEMAQP
jgi:hypothetical protein